MRRSAAILVALFFVLAGSRAYAAPEIVKIRYWAAPEHTRIVIDTSEEASIKVDKSTQKLSILFKDCELSDDVPAEKAVNKRGIDKILVEEIDDDVRIDLLITSGADANVFKLAAIQDKPYRIVVDLTNPEWEKKESEERKQTLAKIKDRVKIVIIDPGHGGEDPGAIGKKKTREKDVVLQISKKLESDLNRRNGYRAFLTRNGDYYPSFKKRLQIAREYGADLFVSIHADAARNRSARGGSVYCLSTSGASSEAAKIIARNENLADIIGGAENDSAGTDESDQIMLNMIQTENINMSKTLASIVLSNMSDVNKLKFMRVQEAPLRVLKLPHIPSVLVETAYISNPVEEQLLKDQAFQKKVAHAVAESIVDFLSSSDQNGRHPAVMAGMTPGKKPNTAVEPASPAGKGEEKTSKPDVPAVKQEPQLPAAADPATAEQAREPAPKKAVKKGFTYYSVRKGDSLEKIAHRNNITLAELLEANNMKARGPLYVNKKLKIPTGEKASQTEATEAPRKKERTADKYYTVKRGDKLSKIAIRFNTTIPNLLKLNNMKRNDPLIIGRKLRVSGEIRTARAQEPKSPPSRAEASSAGKTAAAEEDEETPDSQAGQTRKKRAISYYVVKEGDTLEKIALRNKTTVPELMKLNNMKKKKTLLTGRRLKVPAGEAKTAKAKESISSSAKTETSAAKKTKPTPEADEVASGSQGAQKKEEPIETHYVVKKGDTLEKIAIRNNTTIPALMKLNNMKKGQSLNAGRRIRVAADPEPEKEVQAAKPAAAKPGKNAARGKKKENSDYSVYVVKKGETLEKIAAKNHTTIAALLKLNNMKMKDPLLAGKKLKIPAE